MGFCNNNVEHPVIRKQKLSYPLKCGLLQRRMKVTKAFTLCCHTHSNVGFCNDGEKCRYYAMLSCHTHSNVGFCNPANVEQSRSLLVVIPTQMWASATHGKDCVSVDVFVVIPTQMWASATNLEHVLWLLPELSYPLKCGLLQHLL